MSERFWLWCLDVLLFLGAWRCETSAWRWRAYLWCTERASDAHWARLPPEQQAEPSEEETPF